MENFDDNFYVQLLDFIEIFAILIEKKLLHDEDSVSSGGVNVDIVESGAGASDEPQVFGGLQQLLRHFGLGADDEAVIVAHLLQQLLRRPLVGERDADAVTLEDAAAHRIHRIADENFADPGHHFLDANILVG